MFTFRGLTPVQYIQLTLPVRRKPRPNRVFICIADHFEPMWKRPAASTQMERVERWIKGYPNMVSGLADSRGRPPQHTFFFPQDEYRPEFVEPITKLCRQGFGDVEVHLHHDNDTSNGLRDKLLMFCESLHNVHGLLRRDDRGRLIYAFIHGNWALDNSRPDGRYCGVNDEITVLLETGCYADLTMPSAPSECQTSTMNSIYYAKDDPLHCKSHDRGVAARTGSKSPEDSLLMIQGPLALDWSKRKWGLLPGIENGELTGIHPPTLDRLQMWLNARVCVENQDKWAFVKLHTHGAQDTNANLFLNGTMRTFHQTLSQYATSQEDFKYYYVTAFEMASLVWQAERGADSPDFSFPVRSTESAKQISCPVDTTRT